MSAPSYVLGFLLVLTGVVGYFAQTPSVAIVTSGTLSNDLQITLFSSDSNPLELEPGWAQLSPTSKEYASTLQDDIISLGNSREIKGWYAIVSGDDSKSKLSIYHNKGISLSSNDWTGIRDSSGNEPKGSLGFGKSPTALIPAIFGLIFIGCAFGSQRKESRRKLLMHIAAVIGLLGTIVPAKMAWSSYQTNDRTTDTMTELLGPRRSFEKPSPVRFLSQGVTATLCFFFLILCIQSFVKARKQSKTTAKPIKPMLGRKDTRPAGKKDKSTREATEKDKDDDTGELKKRLGVGDVRQQPGRKDEVEKSHRTKPSAKPLKGTVPMPPGSVLKKPSESPAPFRAPDSKKKKKDKDEKKDDEKKEGKKEGASEKDERKDDTIKRGPGAMPPDSVQKKPSESPTPLRAPDSKKKDKDKKKDDEKKEGKHEGASEKDKHKDDTIKRGPGPMPPDSVLKKPSESPTPLRASDSKKKKKKKTKDKKKDDEKKEGKHEGASEKDERKDDTIKRGPGPMPPESFLKKPSDSSAPSRAPDSKTKDDDEGSDDERKEDQNEGASEKDDRKDDTIKRGPGPMPPESFLKKPSESSVPSRAPDAKTKDDDEGSDDERKEADKGNSGPTKPTKFRITGNQPIRFNRPKPSESRSEKKEEKQEEDE